MNPCKKDCPRRAGGCRSECPDWKTAQALKAVIWKARSREVLLDRYCRDAAIRRKRLARTKRRNEQYPTVRLIDRSCQN